MRQQTVVSAVAIAISLVWCALPVLIAAPVIRLVQPGDPFQAAIGFLSGGGLEILSVFILPVLGALTIVKKKYIVPKIVVALVLIFVVTWIVSFFAYMFSFEQTRVAIFEQDLNNIRIILRNTLESSVMYVLLLLGIKASAQ